MQAELCKNVQKCARMCRILLSWIKYDVLETPNFQ
nr:MAG TPA: hypothetical protein [Caudoviricetes sp.]